MIIGIGLISLGAFLILIALLVVGSDDL